MPGTFTTEGMNQILDDSLRTPSVYVGLVNNAGYTAYAEGDTAAQIGGTNGWAETHTTYSNATRPAYDPAAASGAVLTNSASTADFSMTATITVRGAFIVGSSTKGGTGSDLYAVGDFSGGSASLVNGNTLKVTIQATATDNTV